MSIFQWIAAAGGNWNNALDWGTASNGFVHHGVPGKGDTAEVSGNSTITVTSAIAAGTIILDASSVMGSSQNDPTLSFGINSTYSGVLDMQMGNIDLNGHTLGLSGASNTLGGQILGGTLKVTGAAVIAPMVLTPNAAYDSLIVDGGAVLEDGGSMTQNGNVNLEAFSMGNPTSVANGTLEIDAGATYTVADLAYPHEMITGGTFVNNGTLTIKAGNTLTLDGDMNATLNGTINGAGTLALDAATATIDAYNLSVGGISLTNATLTINGGVGAGESFHFEGGAHLVLGAFAVIEGSTSGSPFKGQVTGFAAGDSIDALSFGNGTKLAYSENSAHTGGTLTLTYGGISEAVNFIGNYTKANFHAVSGNAGTMLTFGS